MAQDNILEAGINSILKNNRIKQIQGTGIVTITDVNDDLIQIGSNMLAYDTAAATLGKINIALQPYATTGYVNNKFNVAPTVAILNNIYADKNSLSNYYCSNTNFILW